MGFWVVCSGRFEAVFAWPRHSRDEFEGGPQRMAVLLGLLEAPKIKVMKKAKV